MWFLIPLLILLGLLLIILINDSDCDKYKRYQDDNYNLSKIEIVEKYFPNSTTDDKKYIVENC